MSERKDVFIVQRVSRRVKRGLLKKSEKLGYSNLSSFLRDHYEELIAT